MKQRERRNAANAALRVKVDQIQALRLAIQDEVAQIQARTLTSVRQAQVSDLPNVALLADLSPHFHAQRQAMAKMEQQIVGEVGGTHGASRLSEDEMAALFKPDDIS